MEARELMLDDFVYHKVKNIDGSFRTDIEQLNEGILRELLSGTSIYFSIEDYSPIPLTAEILEKNGFRRHNHYQYLHKDNYCKVCVSIAPRIEIDGMDLGEPPINVSIEGALFDIDMSMSAIHELQHALRLCGLTELADNFKVE